MEYLRSKNVDIGFDALSSRSGFNEHGLLPMSAPGLGIHNKRSIVSLMEKVIRTIYDFVLPVTM